MSMTGFGRSKKELDSFSITVEVKTVNHRFSEYYFRMPRHFNKIEDKMKKTISTYLHRGRIEVYVTIDGQGMMNRKVQVDWPLLEGYVQAISQIQQKYALEKAFSLRDLLEQDEVIQIEEEEVVNEEIDSLLLEAVEEAVLAVKQMRGLEGAELEKDLKEHLHLLQGKVSGLKSMAPLVVEMYQERLTKRIQEFVSGQIDENRILTEVAIFADKADINEELTRLDSHLKQFANTLELSGPIGRKLDFLVQEMNREINTIGSKANDSSIAKEVVEMKSILEKMKEQVQNIE